MEERLETMSGTVVNTTTTQDALIPVEQPTPEEGQVVVVTDELVVASVVTPDFTEMTITEASAFERDFILGDADFVLPDGRTKGEVRQEAAEGEQMEAENSRRREAETLGMAVGDEPHKAVRVGFVGGRLLTQPISNDVAETGVDDETSPADLKRLREIASGSGEPVIKTNETTAAARARARQPARVIPNS